MTTTAIDSQFNTYSQGYELTRTCKLDTGHTVRLRVRRDSYKQQSHAVAEVLTPALTWTDLVSQSPESWYQGSPHVTNVLSTDRAKTLKAEALLNEVATGLLDRAAAVLAAFTR